MDCVITGVCAFEVSTQRPRDGEEGLLVFQRRRVDGRRLKELWGGFGILGLRRHVAYIDALVFQQGLN